MERRHHLLPEQTTLKWAAQTDTIPRSATD